MAALLVLWGPTLALLTCLLHCIPLWLCNSRLELALPKSSLPCMYILFAPEAGAAQQDAHAVMGWNEQNEGRVQEDLSMVWS